LSLQAILRASYAPNGYTGDRFGNRHCRVGKEQMTDRARGILLVMTASIFWGLEPLWVRKVGAGDWQILFWSGGLMAAGMFAWLARVHGRNLLRSILDTGRPGLVAVITLTLAYSGYILSLNRTTVANTVVLLATAPLIAALLGRIFLGERLRRRTLLAMFLAFAGVLTMVSSSLGGVQLAGDLIALATGACFAINIPATQWHAGGHDAVQCHGRHRNRDHRHVSDRPVRGGRCGHPLSHVDRFDRHGAGHLAVHPRRAPSAGRRGRSFVLDRGGYRARAGMGLYR
jgi:threonine/homoserine efflux transporter RhtA